MAGLAAGLALGTGAGLSASGGGGGHHADRAEGVIGLDVSSQGEAVDLLVAVRTAAGVALRHQRSSDGGRSWTAPTAVPIGPAGIHPPHRGADPQVAAWRDHVVALWTVPGGSTWGDGPLASALSPDGGRTWTAGPNPADDGSTGGHGFADVAADADGVFHAVWLDARDGGQGLRAARSADFGRTWEANRTLDRRTCECCSNKVVARTPGRVLALYRDTDPRDMALAASGDGGWTWSRRGAVGAFDWRFDGCPHVGGGLAAAGPDADGRLHALVWTGRDEHAGLFTLESRDGGEAWDEPRRLGGRTAQHGDLAGEEGRLAAVWDEVQGEARVVVSAVSGDGGRTWTAPVPLSDRSASASHPLVVAAGDRFLAFWTERRGDGPREWRMAPL